MFFLLLNLFCFYMVLSSFFSLLLSICSVCVCNSVCLSVCSCACLSPCFFINLFFCKLWILFHLIGIQLELWIARSKKSLLVAITLSLSAAPHLITLSLAPAIFEHRRLKISTEFRRPPSITYYMHLKVVLYKWPQWNEIYFRHRLWDATP